MPPLFELQLQLNNQRPLQLLNVDSRLIKPSSPFISSLQKTCLILNYCAQASIQGRSASNPKPRLAPPSLVADHSN